MICAVMEPDDHEEADAWAALATLAFSGCACPPWCTIQGTCGEQLAQPPEQEDTETAPDALRMFLTLKSFPWAKDEDLPVAGTRRVALTPVLPASCRWKTQRVFL